MSEPQITTRAEPARTRTAPKLWKPKRLLVTPAALDWEHGRAIVEQAEREGLAVTRLKVNRLSDLTGEDARRTYVKAKSTLAVVVAPPTKLRLQPIPPSADWRVDLAEGCPAHCQYCYLAGSLSGPPVTRAYANLPEILENLAAYVGRGAVTSRSEARAHEGTTFEASCYTDPSASSTSSARWAPRSSISAAGRRPCSCASRRSSTPSSRSSASTMTAHPRPLLRQRGPARVPLRGRERRGSTGASRRWPPWRGRAIPWASPSRPSWRWRAGGISTRPHRARPRGAVGIPDLDLTAELITHRFTPGSKSVLLDWYPATQLDPRRDTRARKTTKFGSLKFVYTPEVMRDMRAFFTSAWPSGCRRRGCCTGREVPLSMGEGPGVRGTRRSRHLPPLRLSWTGLTRPSR
jgi:spore photoproduct lyase